MEFLLGLIPATIIWQKFQVIHKSVKFPSTTTLVSETLILNLTEIQASLIN